MTALGDKQAPLLTVIIGHRDSGDQVLPPTIRQSLSPFKLARSPLERESNCWVKILKTFSYEQQIHWSNNNFYFNNTKQMKKINYI